MDAEERAARLGAIRQRWIGHSGWGARPVHNVDDDVSLWVIEEGEHPVGHVWDVQDADAIARAPDDVAWLIADVRLTRYALAGIARVIDAEADDASWDAGTARRLLARIAVAVHAGLGDLQTWLHEEETT